ncbi:hypothetical protein KEJ26_02390 [Candidatus Bathyarchaeota archaeon]|nr:hypothetical protein [Candidatus Bathyarchaeota archaeon]
MYKTRPTPWNDQIGAGGKLYPALLTACAAMDLLRAQKQEKMLVKYRVTTLKLDSKIILSHIADKTLYAGSIFGKEATK